MRTHTYITNSPHDTPLHSHTTPHRFAERKGWRAKTLELSPAAEGFGIKSALLEVEGENAYGILAAEKGGCWGGGVVYIRFWGEDLVFRFFAVDVETNAHSPHHIMGKTGTHRLVRISPFNANGKRQTSFAGTRVLCVYTQTIHHIQKNAIYTLDQKTPSPHPKHTHIHTSTRRRGGRPHPPRDGA